MHRIIDDDDDDKSDAGSTLPPDSDSDADTFIPSGDPMVRQPIQVQEDSSSPGIHLQLHMPTLSCYIVYHYLRLGIVNCYM